MLTCEGKKTSPSGTRQMSKHSNNEVISHACLMITSMKRCNVLGLHCMRSKVSFKCSVCTGSCQIEKSNIHSMPPPPSQRRGVRYNFAACRLYYMKSFIVFTQAVVAFFLLLDIGNREPQTHFAHRVGLLRDRPKINLRKHGSFIIT